MDDPSYVPPILSPGAPQHTHKSATSILPSKRSKVSKNNTSVASEAAADALASPPCEDEGLGGKSSTKSSERFFNFLDSSSQREEKSTRMLHESIADLGTILAKAVTAMTNQPAPPPPSQPTAVPTDDAAISISKQVGQMLAQTLPAMVSRIVTAELHKQGSARQGAERQPSANPDKKIVVVCTTRACTQVVSCGNHGSTK